jgi:molecular chaperone GrpE
MMNDVETHSDPLDEKSEPMPAEGRVVGEGAPEAVLAQKEAELAELKDRLLRQVAESENMRRRLEREREEASVYAVSKFARDLLSVADNLARALQGVPEAARADQSLSNLIVGIEMTERELTQVMGRFGVNRIEAEGTRFDANLHQAVAEVESAETAPGVVLQVFQPGYRIKERLLRPAMVSVAKAPQSGTAAEAGASPQRLDTKA